MIVDLGSMTCEEIIEYLKKKNITVSNPLFLTYNEACAVYKHKDFDSFDECLKVQALLTVDS